MFKSIKCDIFQLNASSVEYSTDPVEYTTEVRQLIETPHFTCAESNLACKQALRMGYSEICFRIARGRARERACNDPCTI